MYQPSFPSVSVGKNTEKYQPIPTEIPNRYTTPVKFDFVAPICKYSYGMTTIFYLRRKNNDLRPQIFLFAAEIESADAKNSQIIAICCQILHTWNSTPP
jgi:hypothetical protein